MIDKINLEDKLKKFSDHWSPKIIGELNESYIKLVKFKGEFVWHHHEHEDELFFVVKGQFTMRQREGDVVVREGECIIMPKKVEHMPFAEEEVCVLLIEPKTTLNTGNVKDRKTVEVLERI